MDDGVTPVKLILDKPLNQLTEEDISQLTREDCRNFLKEKGMRRPSWNKSQAIQQVISLKALLEPSDDSGAGALRRILVSPPENAPRVTSRPFDSPKELVVRPIAVQEDQGASYSRKDPLRSTELSGRPLADADRNKGLSPRYLVEANDALRQMTIFYCGKVNVYDRVSPEKAQSIMQLAAGQLNFSQNDCLVGNTALWSSPSNVQLSSEKCGFVTPNTLICQTTQTEKLRDYPKQYPERGSITHEPDAKGQANRKISLQRYFKKRKDRGRIFKSKRTPGVASSSLVMYLNNPVRPMTSNGQSSPSSTSSPSQPGLPRSFCGLAENRTKNIDASIDLNSEDV